MLDFGILGMNARNLQYIKKFNPAKAIRLADNKFKTKRFLGERGIPVPATYDIIKTRDQLYQYDFSLLPSRDFIVKPVRGSRGRGIYRIQLTNPPKHVGYLERFGILDQIFTKHSLHKDQRYKISGEYVDDTTMRRYLVDILDGKNSLTRKRDSIMLEELLVPGAGFEAYCEHGLADIRVIVFNLVPVAAMLRVPTSASDGKANLDRGAIGMGIEVGSGKIYAMYQNKQIFTDTFPAPYTAFLYKYLPYRDDILTHSSKIQYLANLGYLALDRVITDEGPKLLEINARAGLKFQNASLLPLKKRLHRIKDMTITNPEKGVEIAQTLFSASKSKVITNSKVLYLRQDGVFKIHTPDKTTTFEVIVEVDLKKKHNYISRNLYKKLQKEEVTQHQLQIKNTIIFKNKKRKELDHAKNKVILGRSVLSDYYIKPTEQAALSTSFITPSKLQKNEIDDLHWLDTKTAQRGRILNLSKILRPINILEQLDNFVTRGGNYNPTFSYRRPSDCVLDELEEKIHKAMDKYFTSNTLQSDFAHLFVEKLEELQHKLQLVRAYKQQDYAAIREMNTVLFGKFDATYLQQAKEKIFSTQQDRAVLGELLHGREVRNRVIQYLQKRGLGNVKVEFDQDSVARIAVSKRGKQVTIKISPRAKFRELELRATLAHEVDIHVMRYIHGLQTGWQIMKSGTAGYIKDEEGLAVYASTQHLPAEYERLGSWYRYFFLHQGQGKSFAELAGLVRGLRGYSLARTFTNTLRMKKGLETTGATADALYMKDKIYLDGYMHMQAWIAQGGDREKLMIGKIKTDDLKFIS